MNAKADLTLAWKPDAARAVERMRAWWEGEILDRPTLQVTAPLPAARPPPPAAHHAALRDRWMDAEYASTVSNTRPPAPTGAANACPCLRRTWAPK